MRAWVKDSNMKDFRTMLAYTADKFTPTGSLCHYKDKADAQTLIMMPTNPCRNSTTSGGILHMSSMNLTMIQMILNLIILSVNTIGCPKQEENS